MGLRKKLLVYFTFILMSVFFAATANVQGQTVSGTVFDAETDETLPGTNVVVKGTQVGTSSDTEGNFNLEVPSLNDTLVVSYIGYQTRQVLIQGRTTLEISLQPSAFVGEDLVVTAFGVEREERSLSYSTEGIDTESLTEARELNVINSLKGKVAGVDIHSGASGLGSDTRVVLRGNRSISGDSQPLYVVDGVPIRGNPGTLNSDNIKSMNVLKGPNAAALYGEEAQDGAIIIETVKGQAGDVDVSFNNTFMARDPIHYMDFQHEYGQGNGGVYEKSSEKSWGPRMEGQMVDNWSLDPDAADQYALTPQPNTKKDFYQRGYNMASNIRAMVGGERTQSVFSYTFTKGEGVIPTNELRRHNLMVRVSSQLTDKLSLDSKLDYSNQLIDNPIAQGRSNFNPNRQIYRTPPNIRTEDLSNFEYTDANGLKKQNWYNPGTTTGSNPYWMLYRNIQNNIEERTIALASLTYDFSEAVSLMIRGSYDGENSRGDEKEYYDTFTRADFGRYTVTRGNALQYTGDFLLAFQQDFTEDWNINANFGGSLEREENSFSNLNTNDALLIPNFFTLSNTSRPSASYDPGVEIERQALYASANIGWRDQLYLDVTGRNDWSSTLPSGSRSYFYPSVGLSAILTDLIPAFPDYFSFAKVRASWAKVGSSAPAYMGFRSAIFEPGGKNGYLSLGNVLPNEDLKPEQTESYEIGLNLRFFENRLGLDATAYKTNTYNQLFTIALPIVSGAESFFTNGGDVQNKGVELSLNTVPVQSRSLNWNFDINFSLNNSLVKEISDERPRVVVGGDPYFLDLVVEQGKPFGELYSRGFQRDDQGRIIVNSNGLPNVSSGRSISVGNFNPDWKGGISSSLSYQNFSFSFLIDHRQGGDMAMMSDAILAEDGQLQRTVQGRDGGLVFGQNFFSDETAVLENGNTNDIEIDAESFWKHVGGEAAPVGEVFTRDATNTRLREMILGYNLPSRLIDGLGISNAKISIVGRNLFYIYRKTKNLDPDITVGTGAGTQGFVNFSPPTTRQFGMNLELDF